MKRRPSTLSMTALIGAAGLIVLCALFALVVILTQTDSALQVPQATVRNPLDRATDGVSMLLRGNPSTDEYFSANYFPTRNGAKGDGISNDTNPIAESLQAATAKGGTVYLPQGVYRITDPLTIPTGVTLRGDFAAPDSKESDGAKTVLLITDTPSLRETEAITLQEGAALIGVTVYYEKQLPDEIIEYPATVACIGNATIRQITLLNSYQGISVSGSGTVKLSSLWASPLNYGIRVEDSGGYVSIEDVTVSPTYWLNYNAAPFFDSTKYDELTQYLHKNLQGVVLGTVTDVTLNRISVEDAAIGFLFQIPEETDGILLTNELTVSSTDRPLVVQSLPASGICISDSSFRPDNDAGADTVEVGINVTAPILFSNCVFSGLPKTVITAENKEFISFFHCDFGTWWDECFNVSANTFLAVRPTFHTGETKATLGNHAFGLLYQADAMEESSHLLFSVPEEEAVKIPTVLVDSLKVPQKAYTNAKIFSAQNYGVSTSAEDNAPALQQALNAAAEVKGIVFLPEGNYHLAATVTVPEGVRLIGAGDSGLYSTILTFELAQNTDYSMIELMAGSSVEDLAIWHPPGATNSDRNYAVSSMYNDVRIVRVRATAGQGIWLTSAETATLESVTLQSSQIGLHLQNMGSVTVRDLTVTDTSARRAATAIRGEDSGIFLSGIRVEQAGTAIELTGAGNGTATLLSFKNTNTGVRCSQSGEFTVTSWGIGGSTTEKTSIPIRCAEEMSGTLTVQGLGLSGTESGVAAVQALGGSVTLQATLFATDHETTVQGEGTAVVKVYGSIWDALPTAHATATEHASVSLTANLLPSDRTFEGLDGRYLITAGDGTLEDSGNLIKYVYIPSEEGGMESGSGAQDTPNQAQ